MIHSHQHFDILQKIILERVIFTPPLRLEETMTNEACLLYSVSGKSTLYGEVSKYDMTPESGVLMRCGNYFNHWQIREEESKNEAVAIHFYPDVLAYIYKDGVPEFLLTKQDKSTIDFQFLAKSEWLKSYIDSLIYYFENPEIVDEDIIILKVKELLNLLYKFDSHNIRDLLGDLFKPNQVNFKKIIEDNLYENLSLQELAHLTNLSLATFKRKFNEIFGSSPATYIREKKLQRATELLAVSDDTILSICVACGFSSLDNFSKTFRKTYGQSPSDFRKQAAS